MGSKREKPVIIISIAVLAVIVVAILFGTGVIDFGKKGTEAHRRLAVAKLKVNTPADKAQTKKDVVAKLFSDLDKLEIGDRFTITVMSEVFTYQVEQTKNVEPYEVDDLQIEPGQDICTLFTCTPYGVNTQRLFVRARRVPNAEVTVRRIFYTNEAYRVTPAIVAPVLALPVLLLLYILMLTINYRRRHNRKSQLDDHLSKIDH